VSLATPQRLDLQGEAGRIEAVVEVPQGMAQPAAFVVVCHPHPLHGGTMDNKVVTTIARTAHECGLPTIRFNFRGVGDSEGGFDEGRGETRDALAAIAKGRQAWPGASLVLAGFSFGGFVALRASTDAGAGKVDRLLTVASALGRNYATPRDIQVPSCPWLLLQGEADDVVDPRQAVEWAASLAPPPEVIVLPGVGHFFHGALNLLREHVARFLPQPAK
jgi:hypothetical protein